MKQLFVVLLFTLLSIPSLFSQVIQYEIKVKYNSDASGTTANIYVSVKEGNPVFRYSLLTNDPFNGEVLETSGSVKNKSYVFRDVKPGKYFVKIEDNMGLPAGKTVVIKENETSLN